MCLLLVVMHAGVPHGVWDKKVCAAYHYLLSNINNCVMRWLDHASFYPSRHTPLALAVITSLPVS
jgi:hypothetical protein